MLGWHFVKLCRQLKVRINNATINSQEIAIAVLICFILRESLILSMIFHLGDTSQAVLGEAN